MGELHLEILVDRLRREHRVEASVGKPQVAYRETVQAEGIAEGEFIRHAAGKGQYGHVRLSVKPHGRGEGFAFEDRSSPEEIPREFLAAIRSGVEESMERGVLADFPMVDVKATLLGGSFHDTDSSDIAFKIAAGMAFQNACRKASPVVLEPVMALTCIVPEEYVGAVIGDINGRRGRIGSMEMRGSRQTLRVEVPLAELFGYVGDLRSLTQGRGDKSMQFLQYQPTPKNVQDAIVLRLRGGY
jgi:elongation factor G